jgi:hypothetical protein
VPVHDRARSRRREGAEGRRDRRSCSDRTSACLTTIRSSAPTRRRQSWPSSRRDTSRLASPPSPGSTAVRSAHNLNAMAEDVERAIRAQRVGPGCDLRMPPQT